jgi:hypothetical protein
MRRLKTDKKMAYPDLVNLQEPPFCGGHNQETPNESRTMYESG